MAQLQYLTSALATGTALFAVAYLLVRTNRRRGAATAGAVASRRPQSAEGSGASRIGRLFRTPVAWYLGFAAGALGVVAAGIAAVAGVGGGAVAALALGALVGLYLVVGTYATAKSRGRPESLAVAEGIGVLGALALLGMVVVLVLG